MAIDLQKLNSKQAQRREEMIAERTGDKWAIYELRMREDVAFEFVFLQSTPAGDLVGYTEEKIRVVLPARALQRTDSYYDPTKRGNYVGIKKIEVKIDKLDKENNTIYLKSGRINESIITGVVRILNNHCDMLKEAKEKGTEIEPLDVYGTVEGVINGNKNDREYAIVSIYGQNIRGIIHVANWAQRFMTTLPEGVEETGEPLHFEVIGRRVINYKTYFELSQVKYAKSEWDNLPSDITEDSVLVMKCLDASNPKYWYGVYEPLGLEWRGNYTDKFKIVPGREYLCKLKRVEKLNDAVWVTPFKFLRDPNESAEDAKAKNMFTAEEIRAFLDAKNAEGREKAKETE